MEEIIDIYEIEHKRKLKRRVLHRPQWRRVTVDKDQPPSGGSVGKQPTWDFEAALSNHGAELGRYLQYKLGGTVSDEEDILQQTYLEGWEAFLKGQIDDYVPWMKDKLSKNVADYISNKQRNSQNVRNYRRCARVELTDELEDELGDYSVADPSKVAQARDEMEYQLRFLEGVDLAGSHFVVRARLHLR